MLKYLLPLLAIVGLHSAAHAGDANKKVDSLAPHFVPGSYSLVKDAARDNSEICGDGDFKFVENGSHILLGAKHGFSLKDSMDKTVAMDDPDEKGCIYENTSTHTVAEGMTIVSSKEVLRCDGVERHSFIETASIYKDKIHLEFKQTSSHARSPSDAAAEYKCDWVLSKRNAASVKKGKK